MAYPTITAQQLKALLDAGLSAHRAGDLGKALAAYRQVLAIAPDHPTGLNLLGTALLQLGRAAEAIPCLEAAARQLRSDPHILANLAQAYLGAERYDAAYASFRKASRLQPNEVGFAAGAAAALALEGKLQESETLLRSLSVRFPDSGLVWFNLGNVLRDQARLEDAARAYEKALALDRDSTEVRNGLGSVLHSLGRFAEAEHQYRECLRLDPEFDAARYNLASVLIDVGRFRDAEAVCREIIGADAEAVEGYNLLSAALGHQGRLVEALAFGKEAALRVPEDARIAAAFGANLMELGYAAEGRRWLADVVDAHPNGDTPRQLLSTALLAAGCLQDGWREHVRRPAAQRLREKHRAIDFATVLPDALRGRSVCVLREQGLGDEIFFLRYARVLAEGGARVTYRASNKLASLLARLPFLETVAPESELLPDADIYMLLGDLPLALGETPSSVLPARSRKRAALIPDVPQRIGAYWPAVPESIALAPLPERVQEWRQRLATFGPAPYIGLTWRAGTVPEQQQSSTWMLYKAIAPSSLASALHGVPGTVLALQRNPSAGELEEIEQTLQRRVHDLTGLNEDLESMLAVLAVIDDYVGVSNTNMHLRAAVGRTARVLVPAPAEWRWMQSGHSTPWFPGFTMYRQSLDGRWRGAIEALSHDLQMNFGRRSRS